MIRKEGYFVHYRGNNYGAFKTKKEAIDKCLSLYKRDSSGLENFGLGVSPTTYVGHLTKGWVEIEDKKLVNFDLYPLDRFHPFCISE